MRNKIGIFSLFLIIVIISAGCAGAFPTEEVSVPVTGEENSEQMNDTDMEKSTDMASNSDEDMESHTEAETASDDTQVMDNETPNWVTAELTDVNSAESFSIQELEGNVILVETLAMWCSNCLKQQKEVAELHALLGERDDFISLGLDIDPNEKTEDLKAYVESNGFDWKYAVVPAEVTREISDLYGTQFLNPPSTPMLIIDKTGQVHPLPFGIKRAEKLLEELKPYLGES